MAWTAKVTSIVPSQGAFDLTVVYYDAADTGFTTPLGDQSFHFPSTITLQQAQNQIIAAGKEYRAAYNLIATYTGATVNIP